MASAQGQVQHLGYAATFPLLLNVVMALTSTAPFTSTPPKRPMVFTSRGQIQ